MSSYIHYDPDREDYTVSEAELDELCSHMKNPWKDFCLVCISVGTPCLINAIVCISKSSIFTPTLEITLNLIVGMVGLVLGLAFAVAWWRTHKSVEGLAGRIRGRPKLRLLQQKRELGPHGKTLGSTLVAIGLAFFGCTIVSAASTEPDNSTPQQVFDGMRKNFHADKAQGVHVRYAFQLNGSNGGEWFVEVRDGKCKIDQGKIDNPDVTFIASDKDWVALSNGKLKGWWAYLTGRLKIRGDQNLARKLDEMFN